MSALDRRKISLPPGLADRLDPVCDRFEAQWLAGATPQLEEFLPLVDETDRPALVRELLELERHYRSRRGEHAAAEEYHRRLPGYADAIASAFAVGRPEMSAMATTVDGRPDTIHPAAQPTPAPIDGCIPGYEILKELGRGGMGVVYKARQHKLARLVALKMIRSGTTAGPDEVARFRTEAEAVARLQHPNIVQIFDIGDHAGMAYISLELVEGGTLASRLKKEAATPVQVALLVATLARAIDHAHQRGIIHRDLKPANVLLTADGTPKITDFGLAKQIEGDSGQTRTGAILGTPSYMAPEQALGQTHGIGPLSDVYALGAILYEMLTGRPPFLGASVLETLEQVRTADPTAPSKLRPGVPGDLETVCLKALAKDPSRRYGSALALANDLDRFRAGEPILARRERLVRKLARTVRRHGGKLSVAALVVVIVSAALVAVLGARSASRAAELQKSIVAALDEEKIQGTPEYVAAVERLIDDLEAFDSTQADTARQKLWERLGQWVLKELRNTNDLAETSARLQPTLQLIAANQPGLARDLTRELDERRDRWEPLFHLVAPFADAAKTLAPAPYRIDGPAIALAPDAKSTRLLTLQTSPQRAEARVVFLPAGWEQAPNLGLALNAGYTTGYTFVIQRVLDPERGKASLQIRRNDALLVQQDVPASALPPGPLELWARREGERLSCQVNRAKVLEFLDPFPLSSATPGVFGLVLSGPAAVQTFAAFRKNLAYKPSTLDKADALFEAKQFEEALRVYRQEADRADNPERSQQARYKEALCLLESGRLSEAIGVLKNLTNAVGERWPVMAMCQLYLVFSERKDADNHLEADAVLDRLLGRNLPEETLMRMLPESTRQRFLGRSAGPFLDFFLGSTKNKLAFVRDFQRTVAVQRLLGSHSDARRTVERELVRAYIMAGMDAEAEPLAREILNAYVGLDSADNVAQTLSHLCWLLRRHGKAKDALLELDRWIADDKSPQGFSSRLLPERARLNIDLQNWAQAEKDVDAVVRDERAHSTIAVDAWMLKGFLRERAGDAAGAQAAWKQGVARYPPMNALDALPSMNPFISYWIMISLSGEPGDEECRKIQRVFLTRVAGANQAKQMMEVLVSQQPAGVYREAWRTARGREIARQWAFRQCSLTESALWPLYVCGSETLHQLAMPGPLSPDHDQLLWDLVQLGCTAYTEEKLGKEDIITAGLTFKGFSWFWSGVEKKMDPPLRGPVSYVLGQRYLQRDAKQAQTFFQSALQIAPAGSVLRRLAQAELDKLKKKAEPK